MEGHMDFEADDYCRGPVLELVETCARFCPSTVGLPFLVVTATDSALLSWHDLVGVSHVFLQLWVQICESIRRTLTRLHHGLEETRHR
jgi:hypothetical protein